MTRFKKECKKRGIRFDEDFPCLPYHENNSSIGIECVVCDAENATVKEYTNVMVCGWTFDRAMTANPFWLD